MARSRWRWSWTHGSDIRRGRRGRQTDERSCTQFLGHTICRIFFLGGGGVLFFVYLFRVALINRQSYKKNQCQEKKSEPQSDAMTTPTDASSYRNGTSPRQTDSARTWLVSIINSYKTIRAPPACAVLPSRTHDKIRQVCRMF